jgi:formate C-acetyltransferase
MCPEIQICGGITMSVIEKDVKQQTGWRNFTKGTWTKSVDVNDFLVRNLSPYYGDEAFLAGATQNTKELWDIVSDLTKKERDNGGVLDVDVNTPATIVSHQPGYLDQSKEQIVGVQTDAPFKRSIQPFGGIRMMIDACEAYGFEMPQGVIDIFTNIRKTHNQGVFDAYTSEMRAARKAGIITGLPDAYGRGRIIGDYRRVALYGVDFLIRNKKGELNALEVDVIDEDVIRLREELSEQIRALQELKQLGEMHGFDISLPATTAKEAFQWLYFGYLAAIKEQNGAAMSLGRVSSFLDIYIERDLQEGLLTEEQAQELVDHFVMKLRIVKFLRTPDYNELFSGDPTWVTESI